MLESRHIVAFSNSPGPCVSAGPRQFPCRKNIANLGDLSGDTDGDGLTDWDEIFRYDTDPKQSDTDGDGISDAAEVLTGSNPLDADENGDGIPDGTDSATWTASPLWVANATNEVNAVTITLNAAIPERFELNNLMERGTNLILSVPESGLTYSGSASLSSELLQWGTLTATVSAHRCDSEYDRPYCSICGHYQPDDISLSFRSPLTLKHDDQTSFSIVHDNAPGETHGDGTIEIRYKNSDGEWWSLGPESELQPWTARFPGVFEVRGRISSGGNAFTTPVRDLTVQFPSVDEIRLDPDVIRRAELEWRATLNDCSTNWGWTRERGYWIALDTKTSLYSANWHTNGIPAGWPTNSPARIYPVVLPERRPLP